MEPNILQIEGFEIMGTLTRIKTGSENSEEFITIWKDFELRHDQIKTHSTDRCYYGASFRTEKEDSIDYVAGMAVDISENIPGGLVLRTIPGGLFAIFSCPVQDIGRTYRYIFSDWLSTSGFEMNVTGVPFEKYPPAEDTVSPILIYIPIRQMKK